ncbi:hypothetical protein EDB80DRAFT_685630 [Ilyonectria destructans]|nr:hypothetical protein EDB80DRAFT_685630 [Ilyonectria destructans]
MGTTWEEQAFPGWLQELRRFSYSGSTAVGSDPLRAVWRTAVADQEIIEGNDKPRLTESELEKVHDSLKNLDLSTVDKQTFVSLGLGNYVHQLQNVSYGGRPFYTSKGHIGIGRCEMVPGDLLYILIGAPVPYILRPDTHGRLRLLGEAYAHGIMDGEAMEDDQPIDLIALS